MQALNLRLDDAQALHESGLTFPTRLQIPNNGSQLRLTSHLS
jgi:hypothetical protein